MWRHYTACAAALTLVATAAGAQGDGFIHKDGQTLFTIGFYELPEDDAGLQAMADAGVNLVRCRNAADLDRAAAVGMYGWVPVAVHQGAGDALRQQIESVVDHPALAIWEGPDEIVWHFTAASTLEASAGILKDDWWSQNENAVRYGREQAAEILPHIREGVAMVRELDPHNRQFWMNEARSSDVQYVRGYVDHVDIVGCDDYPVKFGRETDLGRPLRATDSWRLIGRGKPVWMVLQAFSWDEISRGDGTLYPTFDESRFMAYGCIARGAGGLLYWGSHYLKSGAFRESLYALTSELSALQPFLTAPNIAGVETALIEPPDEPSPRGVSVFARKFNRDWLVVVVNEDPMRHMGTEVSGLAHINGHTLYELYGDERVAVEHGAFVTRMQAVTVKVFCTSRDWETDRRAGRDFGG